jgi:serine protease Do
MAATKTGFILGAVAGAGVAAAVMIGVGLRPLEALADPAPTKVTQSNGPIIFSPPPGAPMSFADIFDRVSPAVVSINVTAMVDRRTLGLPGFDDAQPRGGPNSKGGGDDQDDGDDQGDDSGAAPGGGGDPNTTQALASGSGFFISPDGYIVTNNHVVENAKDIKVVLPGRDQRELPARVIGRDEGTDLAVIKVEGKNFPYVNFENSARPRVGDWVIAVGNPFGLGGTATAGIISANGRDIGEKFVDYIQIDAPINRGNSGGPTFDVYGRVIGINTAIFSPSGGSVGIGFAIPADVADSITKQLIAGGKITRGYLGATIQDISPEIAESLGKPDLKGAMVDELVPGGPAAKAGLQAGDIVLSVNGVAVDGATGLTRQVASSHTGDILRLAILRGGQSLTLEVQSGLRPSEQELAKTQGDMEQGDDSGQGGGLSVHTGVLGLSLAPLDAAAHRKFGVPAEVKGVLVLDLDASSDAAGKGLKPGDVILRVNDQAVLTDDDVGQVVAAAQKAGRANVLLFVYHDHHQAAVAVKIASDADDDAPAPAAKGKSKKK